jgi:hypothetical protein
MRMINKNTVAVAFLLVVIMVAIWLSSGTDSNYLDEELAVGDSGVTESHLDSSSYISIPTSTISYAAFSNERKPLPLLPSDDEWQEMITPTPLLEAGEKWQDQMDAGTLNAYAESNLESYEKYGDIAKRFITSGYFYIRIKEHDVTGDGNSEKIISVDSGGNGRFDVIYVVQGDTIIFKAEPQEVDRAFTLHPSRSGNGFSISWIKYEYADRGYCCPRGYALTHFLYEDEVFVPKFEQEVLSNS